MNKECSNPETGCDYNCLDCEIPTIDPEFCEDCAAMAEENGVEYELLVTYKHGCWTCERCGGGC